MTKRKPKAKGRNFTFILYPDSLPEGWVELLESLYIPMAISPLHNKDPREVKDIFELNDEEIELLNRGMLLKKPHYHVMYCAPNPVTVDSVRNKIKRKLGDKTVSHVEIIDTVEGCYKYLTHESKEAIRLKKPIYEKKDIKLISNFDIDRYITLDDMQKKDLFNAIIRAIIDNKLENILDLTDYIVKYGEDIGVPSLDVLNDVIASRTSLLRMYFDGAYQRRKDDRPGGIKFKPPISDSKNKTDEEKMNLSDEVLK